MDTSYVRQTDMSTDELIACLDNPHADARCFFINELGVIYMTTVDKAEVEKVQQQLIKMLDDEEDSVRYPAYMFLWDGLRIRSDGGDVKERLMAFAGKPENEDMMDVIRDHGAAIG